MLMNLKMILTSDKIEKTNKRNGRAFRSPFIITSSIIILSSSGNTRLKILPININPTIEINTKSIFLIITVNIDCIFMLLRVFH